MAATWMGLIIGGLLIVCIHGEQAQMQELGLDDTSDLASDIRTLQKNVTDLWTYIYQLRQAVEHHLTSLTRRQSRMENSLHSQATHSGAHNCHGSHTESGHQHEPLTSSASDPHGDHGSSDHHHHDEHSTSDHHHDDHGSSDPHHDEHGTSDHHHDEHGDHHQEEHSSSDQHHDEHHHRYDSHGTSGDHQHGGGDYHDEHHHGHHSTSESHTHDHGNHTDSDHSKEHGHDDHHGHQLHGDYHHHHDSHEKADKPDGDHQHSHEHKDSHEKEDKSPDEQQSVEDIEKPFTATVVQVHRHDHTPGSLARTDEQSRSDPLNLLGGHSHHHHHHHHYPHQDNPQQTYEAKVTIPKFSEYRQYRFATCDVQPNRVIAPELQQEVIGQVSLWQKKSGGPLNIHVRLRGFAIGDHHGHQEQQQQTNEAPVHEAGHKHGFHVHEFGDLSAGCQSAGAHYNPFNVNHGGPRSTERHVGDLGNIECDDHGVTNIVFADSVASLTGQHSIVGKALVVHSDPDDYGVNKDDPVSVTTGNAGTRIACCVIQEVEKLPLPTYRSIKSATNYQN